MCKYKRIVLLLFFLLQGIYASFSQTQNNSAKQLEALNQFFAHIAESNASVSEKLEQQQRTFPANLSEQFKQNDWSHLSETIKSIPGAIKDMGLSGTLCIQMDFQNHVLHASSEVYFNTPAEFIRGVGESGQAGWGVLHIEPKEWYLHLGTPTNFPFTISGSVQKRIESQHKDDINQAKRCSLRKSNTANMPLFGQLGI